jgi:hypothetical protein
MKGQQARVMAAWARDGRGKLLEPSADEQPEKPLHAPWRDDPRPLDGLLLSIYAFFGVTGEMPCPAPEPARQEKGFGRTAARPGTRSARSRRPFRTTSRSSPPPLTLLDTSVMSVSISRLVDTEVTAPPGPTPGPGHRPATHVLLVGR